MREESLDRISRMLYGITAGQCRLKQHPSQLSEPAVLKEHFEVRTDGKMEMEFFSLFPGIDLALWCSAAGFVSAHHAASESVLQVSHCHRGRIGWNMAGGTALYLGEGDMSLNTLDDCVDSQMNLPLGYYEGILFYLDMTVLKDKLPPLLEGSGVDGGKLYQKFCAGQPPVAISASVELERIFGGLYDLPTQLRLPYFRVKALELLLYLQRLDLSEVQTLDQCLSRQTELAREIHDFLIQDLAHYYTISDLSKRFLLNTASLKQAFKAVYGQPIASYMKEYRMKRAMELLRTTDQDIGEIAALVGYSSQSKFGAAFKEYAQALPTAYRKFSRKQ